MSEKVLLPTELAALAKQLREKAKKTQKEVAREFNVSQPTVFFAEQEPERGLHKLRKQIIEKYSDYEVIGPVYLVRKKQKD